MKLAANSARATELADLFNYAERLQELIVEFRVEAMNFVANEGGGKRPAVARAGGPRPR